MKRAWIIAVTIVLVLLIGVSVGYILSNHNPSVPIQPSNSSNSSNSSNTSNSSNPSNTSNQTNPSNSSNSTQPSNNSTLQHYSYSIKNTYPHDAEAFTQGLIYEDNVFYEGTGLYGYSSLRKVELSTGRVVQSYSLPNEVFGEGITSIGDKIIQITWQSQKGYVFSKENFEKLDEFSYNGEGWGITHDDSKLIISNGSSILTFLDPVTFQVVGTLEVKDGEMPVINLNELEYVKGDVYANVWHQDKIAIINLQTGQVKGWIDLTGLYHAKNVDFEAVLNGIAYDAVGDRLFVTGKRWAQIFEIEPQLIT